MSYASVTASNISSESSQPQPDPGLLNNMAPEAPRTIDDTKKVNVVPQSFRDSPRTFTSEANESHRENDGTPNTSRRGRDKHVKEAKAEGAYIWEKFKRYLLRPETAGGCIGLLNLGLLGGLGRVLYDKPFLRKDSTFIISTAATAFGLLAVEGYIAEKYRRTPRGRAEERRTKQEGALLVRKAKEMVFRPGVLGGFVGLVNTALLGGLGYMSYTNWNEPHWDRGTISGIAAGLLALFAGEGWLAERYYPTK